MVQKPCTPFDMDNTLQGTNISHLGKRNIIDSKSALIFRRVYPLLHEKLYTFQVLFTAGFSEASTLVGGFNPSEKYSSNWMISPNRGEKKNELPPPRTVAIQVSRAQILYLSCHPRWRYAKEPWWHPSDAVHASCAHLGVEKLSETKWKGRVGDFTQGSWNGTLSPVLED